MFFLVLSFWGCSPCRLVDHVPRSDRRRPFSQQKDGALVLRRSMMASVTTAGLAQSVVTCNSPACEPERQTLTGRSVQLRSGGRGFEPPTRW